MSNPRSNSLFHFTKNKEFLFDILKNGFWPRYCLENIPWSNGGEKEFLAFPMVCFCDIPLSRISEHITFYGSYGLGLSKVFSSINRMNPVLYFSQGSGLVHAVNDLFNTIGKLDEQDLKKALIHSRYIISNSKPTIGKILVNGKTEFKEFYQESEWRYVPSNQNICPFLLKDSFYDSERLNKENERTKKYSSLRISPREISYLIVPNDLEISGIINFMESELSHFPNAELKILYSKIISVTNLNNDI